MTRGFDRLHLSAMTVLWVQVHCTSTTLPFSTLLYPTLESASTGRSTWARCRDMVTYQTTSTIGTTGMPDCLYAHTTGMPDCPYAHITALVCHNSRYAKLVVIVCSNCWHRFDIISGLKTVDELKFSCTYECAQGG